MSLLKKCKVGVRRDVEKKEKAVFGILVLGKDWRKSTFFRLLGIPECGFGKRNDVIILILGG